MKIGSIDILKAYLGALELTNSNAFIGSVPIIDVPTPPVVQYDGLKLTANETSTISTVMDGTCNPDIKYSFDGVNWTQWDYSDIIVPKDWTICFKGNNPSGFDQDYSNTRRFQTVGNFVASGNIMSLIDDGACTTTTIPNNYCFWALFRDGCISDITNLSLPATTLTEGCYQGMFYNNSLLTSVPENLFNAATIMQTNCYKAMFERTSITSIPDNLLSSTTLATQCYQAMFGNCPVVTVPANLLPATTLATGCYYNMFKGCTNLTAGPDLPATTLVQNCYRDMFNGCTNLNYIKCLATNISASNCTTGWVTNVAATGTFVKAENVSWGTGVSGIPTGWTAITPYDGLKMTSTGNSTVALAQAGTAPNVDLKYSLNDGLTWTQWDKSAISLGNGDSVCFKGQNTQFATTADDYNKFVMTGSIAASGNIMSIIDDGACNTTTIPADYCFAKLFLDCSSLTAAPELPATTLDDYCYEEMFHGTSLTAAPELPATTLASYCYNRMFHGTSLTAAPELPATTLAKACYQGMFFSCGGLTTAPTLPATTLAMDCYRWMFRSCTSLTTAPALGATTLAENCYYSMFEGCTSIEDVPLNLLPATTVQNYCYRYMFRGCTSLKNVTYLPATTLAQGCYANMFENCPALTAVPYDLLPATTLQNYCYEGIFKNCTSLQNAPQLPATTMKTGCYASMFEGCTSLVVAPELHATSLVSTCYQQLFDGCTNLRYINCWANNNSSGAYTKNWVRGVSSLNRCLFLTGSITNWTTGDNGIPTNWRSNTTSYNSTGLSFTAVGNVNLYLQKNGSWNKTVKYARYDSSGSMVNYDLSTDSANPTVIYDGETIFIHCSSYTVSSKKAYPTFNTSTSDYATFVMTGGNVYANGNIFSLCFGRGGVPSYKVLYNNDASFLFHKLFYNANHLITSPILYCGSRHNTSAASSMYRSMFEGCTEMVVASPLYETTLSTTQYCYAYMLKNCKHLVVAPILNAPTLSNYCYQHLFRGCSRLGQIKCKATSISATDCIKEWITYIRSNGTLYVDSTMTSASWGVPDDWTVKAA